MFWIVATAGFSMQSKADIQQIYKMQKKIGGLCGGSEAWSNAQDLRGTPKIESEDILSLSGSEGSNPSPRIHPIV